MIILLPSAIPPSAAVARGGEALPVVGLQKKVRQAEPKERSKKHKWIVPMH